ncbi:hypothetical protein EG329_010159 [Mollisiaceae sp. DMI_Dod_QoI]|nr:hypothetical protein EG329_010159 [Helotiales sp. DMI_Dod_QoI]
MAHCQQGISSCYYDQSNGPQVFGPTPINAAQAHSVFAPFQLPSAAQPQTINPHREDRVSFQPLAHHNPDIEERIRAMAPFETPPDSPSFYFIPPKFQQPERCGQSTKCDTNAPIPSTAQDHDPILDDRLQDFLVQAHVNRRISDLLTNIPRPTTFMPSDMVVEQGTLLAPEAGTFIASNGRYQGNRNSNTNKRQIANLADVLNCGLFLQNIPGNISLANIFDMIDTGAVYALHIMPPNGLHSTCAAKLTFMTPEGAAKFLVKAQLGVWFGKHLLDARYNVREGYLCNTMVMSRVLYVEGPEAIMTIQYWFQYFRQVCIFQWDRVLERTYPRSGRKCLEFRFARINGQAQTCLQEIQQQEEFVGPVGAMYGFDPCDELVFQGVA